MRSFTHLTHAFSKKLENHIHSLAVYFRRYNFVRIQQALRSTPAMKAGVTDHLWKLEMMVALIPELKYNTRPRKAMQEESA